MHDTSIIQGFHKEGKGQMKTYWGHQVVDLSRIKAGLGVAWKDSGSILGISLNPDPVKARLSLQQRTPLLSMSSAQMPLELQDQLHAALAGDRVDWTWNPCLEEGTPFQQQVWNELLKCSHGYRWSYSELANRLGKPGASRAVGSACGRNPHPLRIPCHRIVAADGSLGGFTGDLELKRWLLQKEALLAQAPCSSPNEIELL